MQDQAHLKPRLILYIHHALYDAWTLDKLVEDLSYNYFHPQAERPGRKPYSQFIHYITDLDRDEAARYWMNLLVNMAIAQFPPIPNSTYKPQARDSVVASRIFDTTHIKRRGISVATVTAAAWALLLSSYCDTEDVGYATVFSGRDHSSLEDVMGPTIATVPMRIAVRESDDIEGLLATTQNNLLDMQKHQHYGLEDMSRLPVEGLGNVTRMTSILIMQQDIKGALAKNGYEEFLTPIEEESQIFLDYPLVITSSFGSKSGRLELRIQYDDFLLSRLQVQRMLRQLHHIADQLANLDGSIAKIDFATVEDKAEIRTWNPSTLPQSLSLLHELFEKMVSQQPQSPAINSTVVIADHFRQLTYHQLNAYATDLTLELARNGSIHNLMVAVCFNKSPLAVIAMIAVLKAGGAFVPIDASLPTARIQMILNGLDQDTLVITDVCQLDRFPGLELVALDEKTPNIVWKSRNGGLKHKILQQGLSGSQQKLIREVLPDSTAYILHTSGSTGKPKAIVVSHTTSTTALYNLTAKFKFNKATRMLQLASFGFDASVLEIFATLISGGCVCMPPDAARITGELAPAVKEMGVNCLFVTPTVASFLDPDHLPNLKKLILIGESPSRQLLERWMSSKTQVSVFNAYGPAEAGFISCINTSITNDLPTNIGHPVGCHIFVADLSDTSRLAAVGAIGELVVCGHNVSDGYLKEEEATSKVFGVNWPGLVNRGKVPLRYYKTGDLARYCSDGSLQYMGRKDMQRKIHGQRIELGEIESLIRKHTQFFGVTVDLFGSSTIVAFLEIETSPGPFKGLLPLEAIDPKILNKLVVSLKTVLPAYMLPTVYVPVANFPTNSSGKTDRNLLRQSLEPTIAAYRLDSDKIKRQPKTEQQSLLKQMWAEAIPILPEVIGIDDGFFALGGNSVGVIRLLQIVRKRRMKLDFSAVYKAATLSEMAVSLEIAKNPSTSDSVPTPFSMMGMLDREQCISLASQKCDVPQSAVLDLYPCSYMQEAMMMSSAKALGSYFVQSVFRVPEILDLEKLARSLQSVWLKNDILRTRIFFDDRFRSVQVVLDELFEVPILEEDLEKYLRQGKPCGYGEPLSRCVIIASKQARYLVISQHHAVFDAWSLGLMLDQINKEYSMNSIEPAKTGQYASYIRESLQLQDSSEAAQYWRDVLSRSNATRLPAMKKGAFRSNKEHKTIIEMPLHPKYSLGVLIEAAWSIILGRYADSEDVCFGVIQSGRTASINSIDAIMGPTLVSVPRRLLPTKSLPVTDFLAEVERSTIEAQPWEHYGLGNIRNLNEITHQACKFQTMVIVQHSAKGSNDSSKDVLGLEMLEQHGAWSDDCLTLECQPQHHDKLSVSLSYDDKFISEEDIRWISHHVCRILHEMIAKPDHAIEDLDMVGPEGIRQAHTWNDQLIPESTQRIEKLFHERLDKWSTLTAIDAVDAKLDYQKLDELSSRLAWKLTGHGLSRGDLVPLCVEKSATMIVAILGVLKAGGAYVPLEPDLPVERMQYTVKDLNAQFLICTPGQEQTCNGFGCSLIIVDMKILEQAAT